MLQNSTDFASQVSRQKRGLNAELLEYKAEIPNALPKSSVTGDEKHSCFSIPYKVEIM
jgi:hypothetical protein